MNPDMNVFNPFLLTVIPIMVAIDAPGVLPIYLASKTHGNSLLIDLSMAKKIAKKGLMP
jgi:hypothetical protein